MPRRPSLPRLSLPRPRRPSRPTLPRPNFKRPSLKRPSAPPPPRLWSPTARRSALVLAIAGIAAVGFGVGYLVFGGGDEGDGGAAPTIALAPAPTDTQSGPPEGSKPPAGATFPQVATRNTTRVGGADPTADAAAVALASYPPVAGADGPAAAILAPADSWQDAIAATPLTADPVGAPLLLGGAEEVPTLTSLALAALDPAGLEAADGAQLITVGDVAAPPDLDVLAVSGADPAELADAVDAQRAKLTGVESAPHLLVVSSEQAPYAMPAAAWAARSGDPILFADGDSVPAGTRAVIARHPEAPIYVLGPESVISDDALDKLGRGGAKVTRVGDEGPVENAIAFARFVDGDFGWNINDPGHGFAIANVTRPVDAAAAAPLAAAGGTPGPLLLTDDSVELPKPLARFLADTQPGFIDDPTRAVYNHVWLLGDPSAISVAMQAQIDALTELAPVEGTAAGALPGADESQPGPDATAPDAAGAGSDAGGGLTPGSLDPSAQAPDALPPGALSPDGAKPSGGPGSGGGTR